MRLGRSLVLLALLLLLPLAIGARAQTTAQDLRRLSLEELLELEITTVTRRPQPQAQTPAAVHIITQADIRRSGATSLPELLRLVPGMHVARLDHNKWAMGMRGFTDRLSRAMLVMIDGRAVYSPLFAGTYWEEQGYLLEDVDRIEVIRGPGGTLWGANAVNGIVNIVTKAARETQGSLMRAGGGSSERGLVGVRYGGRHGDGLHYRVYGRYLTRAPGFHADGADFDDYQFGQAGFRADWTLAHDRQLTVQGGLFGAAAGERFDLISYTPPYSVTLDDDADLSGGHVVARWEDRPGAAESFRLQVFYDRTNRREPPFREARDTFDVDFQRGMRPLGRHTVTWGLGYRVTSGRTESLPTLRFLPPDATEQLFSAFVQDEIELRPERLRLTLGSKLERDDYSGLELQPSARLMWTPAPAHTFVLSVARAVRTPSRVERDLELTSILVPSIPLFLRVDPNREFSPERLIAYEAGYRAQPANRLALVIAAFYNQLDDVLSTEVGSTFQETDPSGTRQILPVLFGNGLHGNSHGVEVSSDVRLTDWWRWTGSYALLRTQLTRDAGSMDGSQEVRGEGLSPRHQLQWESSVDLPGQVELDWLFRYVSALTAEGGVPAYATSDLRLGWFATSRLELSLVGKDLHDAHHLEFPGGSGGNVEVRRSVFGRVTWRW